MANPQLEHGYTRIAHEILEALFAHELSARELRVAIYLLRETYGWGRTDHTFSIRDIEEEVGLHWDTARKTLGNLVARNIVRLVAPASFSSPGRYGFQKDWQAWQATRAGLVGTELHARRAKIATPGQNCHSPPSRPRVGQNCHSLQTDPEGSGNFGPGGRGRNLPKQRSSKLDSMRDSARLKISKDNYKEIPVAQTSFPQATPAPSGDTPEPPGTGGTGGVKKSKRTKPEFPALVVASIETLDAFLGPLSPELRTRLGNRLLQAIGEHGEADVALALRESIRETIFKRANDPKPPDYPASMAVRYLSAHLAPLRAHQKRQLAEIRKRGLAPGLERAGRFRWATPAGWRLPPELGEDVFLRESALSRYISTRVDWVEDLARRAGLPEGGAGPGPGSIDLTGIGRDLNDLEDPQ